MAVINNVVFDFCGVLLEWQRRMSLDGHVQPKLIDMIFSREDPYGFSAYENRMDAGENLEDIMPDYEAEYGERFAGYFRYYIAHYRDAFPRLMSGMSELIGELHELGLGVWGLTNWSHETIHIAFDLFPELNTILDGTLVSGIEKKHKPNADFYELAYQRFHIEPQSSVFFDDTHVNVLGAQAAGMTAFDFTDAFHARQDLIAVGVPLRN